MGKVLVAFAPPAVREHLLETVELAATGPNPITDRDAWRAEITRVQRDGYAVADEEHEGGIRAVGVPVRDASGIAVGGAVGRGAGVPLRRWSTSSASSPD